MPLYIKDPAVDTLVEQYLAVTGLPSKTEAVRRALSDQLKMLADQEKLPDRVAKLQHRAAEAGFVSTGEDLKPFFDEQWGES